MTHFSVIPKVISSVVSKKLLNISSILTYQLSLTLKMAYFSVLPDMILSLKIKKECSEHSTSDWKIVLNNWLFTIANFHRG